MPTLRGITSINISPFEIVFPQTPVLIETEGLVDATSAAAAIRVAGVAGSVRVTQGRRLRWEPRKALRGGAATLQLSPIRGRDGRPLSEAAEIPFFVAVSKAAVPAEVAVESMVRLRFDRRGVKRLPIFRGVRGSYVEMLKGRHRTTGAPVELAFDHLGRRVEPEPLRREWLTRSVKLAGKLHPKLAAKLRGARASEAIPVAIWAPGKGLSFSVRSRLKKVTTDTTPAEVSQERQRVARRLASLEQELRALGVAEIAPEGGAPALRARLTPAQIAKAKELASVNAIFLRKEGGIDDLGTSMAIANTDDVHTLDAKGEGIRVAVWEEGPDVTTNLSIAGRFDTAANAPKSDHARLTHAVIKNNESGKPKGHAPKCSLYSANSYDLEALQWAIEDAECTVISQSFHREEEQTEAGLSYDDIYKDWLVLQWPFPTILQAAGNDSSPSVEYVNHKGFNSLAVGSHDDEADSMASTSVFRNPESTHSDRELPEICANGTSVSAVGLTKGGTSFAAPAVAGITAVLQSTDNTLKRWPEGCRAILLAGAQTNVKAGTWWADVIDDKDGADGSGAADALESYHIARARRGKNQSGTRRGWDVGTLREADFDSNKLSTFVYRVRVPDVNIVGAIGPRKVKVALAWNSHVTTLDELYPWWPMPEVPVSSQLTLDFDLKVFNAQGAQVGYSGSWDNSYEIAEFLGKPGEVYDIRVRRWSGQGESWFGLAWTVTGSLHFTRRVTHAEMLAAIAALDNG